MCVAKADEFDSFCLFLVQLPTDRGGGGYSKKNWLYILYIHHTYILFLVGVAPSKKKANQDWSQQKSEPVNDQNDCKVCI